MLEEKVGAPPPLVTVTTTRPAAVPKAGEQSGRPARVAFNIAEVLILQVTPWSTRLGCIINALQLQGFCRFQVNADAATLVDAAAAAAAHSWSCCCLPYSEVVVFAQVKHLEVSCSSMAEDICRKSSIIETYVMDSRIGETGGW